MSFGFTPWAKKLKVAVQKALKFMENSSFGLILIERTNMNLKTKKGNNAHFSTDYYLNIPFGVADKKAAVKFAVDQIKRYYQNYIGFKNKKSLADFLLEEIYGSNITALSSGDELKRSEINDIIKEIITGCRRISKNKSKLVIHIFPSYNKFINTQMSGVSGYTSNSRNILIFISPQKDWQTALKNTLAHEFAHAITFRYHKWQTLLDCFIFEGLADNFRESMIGGNPAPWSIALSQINAKKTFIKLKKLLNSKNENLYSQVFLGYSSKYPLWSGYAIGYQIMKSYFKYNKNKSWQEVFKLKPGEILKQSKY